MDPESSEKKDYYLNEYLQFIEPFTAFRYQTGNLQTIQGHGHFDDESESDEAHEDEIDTSMSYSVSSKNPIQSIPKNSHVKKKLIHH